LKVLQKKASASGDICITFEQKYSEYSCANHDRVVSNMTAAACGIDIAGIELVMTCQWVENVIADSACGIMDQITFVTGKEGFILQLVCQPCIPEPLFQLPGDLQIWGIDSGISHQVTGIEYEAARADAFDVLKINDK